MVRSCATTIPQRTCSGTPPRCVARVHPRDLRKGILGWWTTVHMWWCSAVCTTPRALANVSNLLEGYTTLAHRCPSGALVEVLRSRLLRWA